MSAHRRFCGIPTRQYVSSGSQGLLACSVSHSSLAILSLEEPDCYRCLISSRARQAVGTRGVHGKGEQLFKDSDIHMYFAYSFRTVDILLQ
jgi:hypothetical protein